MHLTATNSLLHIHILMKEYYILLIFFPFCYIFLYLDFLFYFQCAPPSHCTKWHFRLSFKTYFKCYTSRQVFSWSLKQDRSFLFLKLSLKKKKHFLNNFFPQLFFLLEIGILYLYVWIMCIFSWYIYNHISWIRVYIFYYMSWNIRSSVYRKHYTVICWIK